jgi:hypothetical protein
MAPSSRMAEYRRQVQARYAPVVATVTTPDADAACARCGVRSFADLLRPFADVSGLNVPMRHNAEAPPYALSEISIRFHGVRECRRVAPEVAEAYARRAFEPWDLTDDDSLSSMLDAVPKTTRDAIRVANANEETPLVSWFGTPWLDRFARRAFRASCAFSDFETADHVRAIVFATAVDASHSSSEANTDVASTNDSRMTSRLVETFTKMSAPYYENPESYPPAIRSEAADPDVARHFIVLHDPTVVVSEACLKAVRDALKTKPGSGGADVFVTALPILGSSEGGSSEASIASEAGREARAAALAHLFARDAEARLVASESPADGSPTSIADRVTLRDEDVEALKTFVRLFATETLLPHMERRLTALNANIASTRKGLKNQLKTFWGRGFGAAGALGGFGGSFGALANVTAGNTGNADVSSGSASSSSHAQKPSRDEGSLSSSNEDSKYSFRSPECEIRLAADLAFSLRDHETAAHHYRLLQSDFKADKAFRRLACAHEGLAHALICLPSLGSAVAKTFVVNDSAKREIDAAFESAVAAHRKSAFEVAETSNWTWRASYSRAVFLNVAGAHRDAALALATVSGDEGLPHHCAAAALEAAAIAFLRTDPPSARKFAMHATLAGHRFAQAGFRAHAARCYASALPAYEDADDVENENKNNNNARSFFPDGSAVKTPWARSREHLHFALGRQIARCGASPAAASHFEKLLFCADGVSAAAQATYLREFLFLDARREAKHTSTLDDEDDSKRKLGSTWLDARVGVCLPEIDVGDVVVGFEDGRLETRETAGDVDGLGGFVSERRWRVMEADGVVPAHLANGGVGQSTWLDAPRAGGKKKGGEQFGVCAAGETVFFSTRFRNPLRIPLSLTEVSLVCDFETENENANETEALEALSLSERKEKRTKRVSATTQDITLRPLETRLVRLACVPETEGTLRARGVSWRLRFDETKTNGNGEEPDGVSTPPTTQVSLNYVPFDPRAPRTRRGSDGVSWVRDTPRLRRLALRVTPAMPKLEVRLLGVPASMPLGGVAKVTLVAKNVALPSRGTRSGSDSLTTDQEGDATAALRVRVRLPMDGLVVLADTSAEPTASSEISAREKDVKRPNLGAASVVVTPETWSAIRPCETVSLALYLRATRLGVVDAPFVVCYEPPEPAPPSLRYRLARVEARIQVTPSLAIHARVSASATRGGPPGPDSLTTDQEGDATAALRVRVRLPMDGLVVLAETSDEDDRKAKEKDSRPKLGAASVVVTPQTWSAIRPGETVSSALYLRATRLGEIDAPFVVCYEPPEPAPPSLRYRLARVEARIQVTPSLAINARVSASATHPAVNVVRVAARNVSASSTFFVRAVRLLASDEEGRNDVCLRPAVRVYGQLVRSAASSKTQTRGLLIEPGKARDAVFLAGPAEALVANDAVRENVERNETSRTSCRTSDSRWTPRLTTRRLMRRTELRRSNDWCALLFLFFRVVRQERESVKRFAARKSVVEGTGT